MSAIAGFAYRAVRGDGTVERGTLAAASIVDARATLERRGLIMLHVDPVAPIHERRVAIGMDDLALGLRMLADLFEAGLPMTRALHAFAELAPRGWQAILPELRDAVRDGKSFGAALRDARTDIPPLVVGMALAGEIAGNPGAAIRRAAEVTEAAASTRAAIRGALAYPIVLALAGSGSIALMIGVVIPRFAAILGDLGQALPPSTRLVLRAAGVAREGLLPAALVAALVFAVIRAWTATANGEARWHAALLRVPVIGTVRRAAATARVTFTLATLLETGVPLRLALSYAARASGDASMERHVVAATAAIEGGQSIARALRDAGGLTPLALRLVQAGEDSGRLPGMLRHAATLEQERADRLTRAAVRMLEPALIIAFAGVVALVAAALLQAVYSIRPTA